MARTMKILALVFAALVAAFALVLVALHQWTGSDDFRLRLEQQAVAALGVPVTLGRITVSLWPLPAVALEAIRVQTEPALTIERVQARPQWTSLLRGRLVVDTLVLRNVVLAQRAIDSLSASLQKRHAGAGTKPTAPQSPALDWLPRRAVLDGLTWTNLQGQTSRVEAESRLDDAGWPRALSLKVLQGALSGTQASLSAVDGAVDGRRHWTLKLLLGGGSVQGPVQLTPAARPGADFELQAELQTRDVEVAALTAPSKMLSGKLEASTTLRAKLADPARLVDALQSQTRFTVRNAAVHGIDLARAVSTVGLSRGGQTQLDTLAGQVASHGKTINLSNLVASSGLLTANGHATVAPNQTLSGRISVDLGSKVVGVPLLLGGTLDAPEVTLSRGALLGAAIGTAVLPGVGTGAGAKLGDRLGEGVKKLFGR